MSEVLMRETHLREMRLPRLLDGYNILLRSSSARQTLHVKTTILAPSVNSPESHRWFILVVPSINPHRVQT
jgi:hypothetical protein